MNTLAKNPPRAPDHRSFVSRPNLYDVIGGLQFSLLFLLGMRENHTLLDIGCGSLRSGRLSIIYLSPGHYFGIEPEEWLVAEGIQHNLGSELISIKQPQFLYDDNFSCTDFGRTFDFFLAHSIFSHASSDQVRRCMSEVFRSTHERSLFLATYNIGDSDYAGTTWRYPSVSYTESGFQQIAKDSGLAVRPLRFFQPTGQTWVLLAQARSAPRLNQIVSRLSFHSRHMPCKLGNRF